MKEFIQIFLMIYLVGHPEVGVLNNDMVSLINYERSQVGLNQLIINSQLNTSAIEKCLDMIKRGYWAHVSPDGTQPWKFFLDTGYRYVYAGENLARDFSSDKDAMSAFMKSTKHRQNILDPDYKEVGIGKCSGNSLGVQTNIYVQHFGSK